MRLSSILTAALVALIAHPAFARDLGGDLDYTVQSENGAAKLVISSSKPDVSVRVVGVTVLAPAERGKDSEQLPIPIPPGQSLAESTTVDLGSVAALAKLVAPGKNMADFRAVAAADGNDCKNCDAVVFALQISVECGDGTSRRDYAEAYLHYFFK